MKIQKDKIGHFIYSFFGTAFLSACVLAGLDLSMFASLAIGMVVMMIIAIIWEFDGVFSWWDILADMLGCIVGAMFILLMWK
jgi:glycerol uptake facilitator-like aquaporin